MQVLNKILNKVRQLRASEWYKEYKAVDPARVKTIFDVGAYQGFKAIQFHKDFPAAQIHCFEPFSDSFRELKKNTSGHERIKANNLAISDRVGERTLHVNAFAETNSLLVSNALEDSIDDLTKNVSGESVPVSTLDQYCQENNISSIDILKLDVQGMELQVLKGATSLLQSGKISFIYCEVEFIEIYKEQALFPAVYDYLKQMDYAFINFWNLNNISNGRLGWADALFVPLASLK